jgi:hypothetical protein
MKVRSVLFGFIVACLNAGPAYADPELSLDALRVNIYPAQPGKLLIENTGDKTGFYHLELLDSTMKSDGAIHLSEPSQNHPYSASHAVILSKNNIILKAGESYPLYLTVPDFSKLQNGEYHSHLKITIADHNINKESRNSDPAPGLFIHSHVATAIPVYIYKGDELYAEVKISEVKVLSLNNHKVLRIKFSRTGNRSVTGAVDVTYIDPMGKTTVLNSLSNVSVYRDTLTRTLELPLQSHNGTNFAKGELRVDFHSHDKHEKNKLHVTRRVPL